MYETHANHMKGVKFMSKRIFLKKHLLAAVILALLAAQMVWPGAARAQDSEGSEHTASFTFSNKEVTAVEGAPSSYGINGTSLTITNSGTYLVSGSCDDGNIKIKQGITGVTLILGGITLVSENTAAICCGKSSGASIIAKSGTVNSLSDSAANNSTDYPDNANAENAVIKCKDGSNVTIGGTGTINITANGKNGIKSGATTEAEGSASLTIEDVTLSIKAPVNDAVNAESLLSVKSGDLDINAADDALHSDYDLVIGQKNSQNGPDIDISTCYEGLEGAAVTVYSGDIGIHSTDDGINAANSDLTDYDFSLEIAGGDVYVDAETGDGLDSNGTLTITGGKTEIFSTSESDNAPIDSDSTFTITGGTVFSVGNSGMAQIPATGSQNYVTFGAGMFMGQPGQQPGDVTPPDAPPTGTPPTAGTTPPQGDSAEPPSQTGTPPDLTQNQTSTISIAAGDALSIADSSGTALYDSTAPRNANYVFYSDSSLVKDGTYTLKVNGTKAAESTVGAVPQGPPALPPSGSASSGSDSGAKAGTALSKSASVTLSKTKYVYNGKAKKPSVTVKIGTTKLKKNVDYTVAYKNNKKVGTGSVIVTGIGSYTGKISKTFSIVPKGTSISGKLTATSKGFTVKWKKKAKSVTGYQVQYSTTKKFTKKKTTTRTIKKASAKKLTVSKLKSNKKYYVRVRTYKTVKGKKYCSAWSKVKSVTAK